MSDRDERKEHGDELVVGSAYCIKFGDYGVGGSFTGTFLGWFPAPDNMNNPPGDAPLMADESHDWAWAKFDTGYVSGDRWEVTRLNP